MAGNVSAWGVAPVVNPSLRGPKGQRLFRMAQEQSAGRSGPVRQTRRRDEVVSPLAFERECAKLMLRAQRAIATILMSQVYAYDLRETIREFVLRQHEWEIAVALREITELLLDLASTSGGGPVGPMTATILVSQNRAISIARDATTARVLSMELLAAEALTLPEAHRRAP
jgi:hypothetical protein